MQRTWHKADHHASRRLHHNAEHTKWRDQAVL
jgi:hypothetical protein